MSKSKIEWTDEMCQRFWAYVNSGAPSDCWEWNGRLFRNGYGQFRLRNRKIKSHRAAYALTFGRIPDGLLVCHHCDNPRCCNPRHLFLGTHKDNAIDRELKGRGVCNLKAFPGESNPAAVLSQRQVEDIRSLVASGVKQNALAAKHGVAKSTISAIIRGVIWRT